MERHTCHTWKVGMALMPHAPATACMQGSNICLPHPDARLYLGGHVCVLQLAGARALAFQKDLPCSGQQGGTPTSLASTSTVKKTKDGWDTLRAANTGPMSLHGPHLHVHADINDAGMTQSLRTVDGKEEIKAHHVAVKSTITCTFPATF